MFFRAAYLSVGLDGVTADLISVFVTWVTISVAVSFSRGFAFSFGLALAEDEAFFFLLFLCELG